MEGNDVGRRPAPAGGRDHALDALRGAMMLLGIYLHAAVAYSPSGNWPWKQGELSPLLDPSMSFIHIFRMPLFYAMAGFFGALLVARRGWHRATLNRIRRILVPFLLGWAIVFPLVVLLVSYGRYGPESAMMLLLTGQFLGYAHPLHLWFLEYLLLLYLLALLVVPAVGALPAGWRAGGNAAFRAIVGSWAAPAILAVPSFLVLLAMPRPELQDPPGFLPLGRILLAYAIPFFFGWLLHANADLLEVLRRRAWVFLSLALIPLAFYLRFIPTPAELAAAWPLRRMEHSLALWLLIFGVTGGFLRLFSGYAAWRRYLCDASYFLYLAHMPVLLALQLLVAPLGWPPLAKVMVVFAAATGLLLLLYHWLVRPGAIGALLNGRRHPAPARGRPMPA